MHGHQGLCWDKSELSQALNLIPVIALTWKHRDGCGVALKSKRDAKGVRREIVPTQHCVLQPNQVNWLIKSKNCIILHCK